MELLWSTPFFPSPQRDNGYDVSDYCAVDPRFGTMADLEELIAEAGKRSIGLMFDMVFNHTSTEHEWFRRALAGEKKYQDYYIFRDGTPDKLPTNWVSKFGGPAWEYVPSLGKWYLHLFDVTQADLNWENPEVREELLKISRRTHRQMEQRANRYGYRDSPSEILDHAKKGFRVFRYTAVNLTNSATIEFRLFRGTLRYRADSGH